MQPRSEKLKSCIYVDILFLLRFVAFYFWCFSEILFLLRFVAFYLYLVSLGSNALWVRTHKGTIQSPKMEFNDTVATSEIGRDSGRVPRIFSTESSF